MPVQFVLGRAGSGKTRYLLDRMIEQVKTDPLGYPIFWLLPRQATFQAERLLTAELGAFSRIRVVSFDQLGKEILIHCGDIGIPEVTAVGRRMIIGHLLRRHQTELKFYSSSAHRPGLATELDATFGEFERAGLDVPTLQDVLNKIEPDDPAGPALRDKLSDLHLLLDAYNQYVGQAKLDPQRRLTLILKRVSECSLLTDAQLIVDDFYDFSANERKLLTAVAGVVRHTSISLLIDPASDAVTHPAGLTADLSKFHRTERTYRSLLSALHDSAVPVEAPVLLARSMHSSALSTLEQDLFTDRVPANAPAMQAFDAPDSRSEIDAVARRIKSAIASGARYRDVGVLVRNLADYQDIIDASFAEHGIPYFADRRRTAGHHPLLQMVRAALQIARHLWPHDAVMTLIKSGLAGLNDDQADELENYVLQHRIRGRLWQSEEPWAFSRKLTTAEDEAAQPAVSESDRIDAYRRSLLEKLSPLLGIKKPLTVRDLAHRIFTVLDGFNVRATLQQWMTQAEEADDLERRDEHAQIWSEFIQLFDHMVELLGDEAMTLVDFINVLDSGLESFDLALIPVKVDQVLVGQLDRTRTPDLKIVFVPGLNEGMFPRVQSERCVITDRERRALSRREIHLDPDSERRLLDERFLAYVAFTRPSQKLIVSRSTSDPRGRATNPSSFWIELFRLAPAMAVEHVSRGLDGNAEGIGTSRQVVSGLMRWVRTRGEIDDPLWPAVYQWMVTLPPEHRLRSMRDLAWPALRYTNAAELTPALADQIFSTPLQVKVRQLETFAECPFRHFARYGLNLRDRDKPDVTTIDLSNAYHDILENLVKDVLESNTDWCALDPAEANEMIRLHAAEIGRRLRGELMLSTARNRYLLDRIEQNLQQSLATMMECHRRGKYRPAFAGVRFGKGGTLPTYVVPTPAGNEVHLHGQIDRVDLNDRRTGFIVSDYKLAAGALSIDRVYHGLSLQLLTYLLVIQENGQELVGHKLTPAAAFLLQLLRSPDKVDHPAEGILPDDPNFHLRIKPRGILDARAIKSLDANLTEGASDVINVFINKTGERGRVGTSDAVEQAEFEALLQHVEKRLGELADQIATGNIAVTPHMLVRKTPCSHCEFRSVCRFEPGLNQYRMLQPMKRDDVITAVTSHLPQRGDQE